MKARTTLILACRDYRQAPAEAVARGPWAAHRSLAGRGLAVSHRSGVRLVEGLTEPQAARLLRRLREVPAAPVGDDELRAWAAGLHPDVDRPVRRWKWLLARVVVAAGVATPAGR